MLLPDLDLVKTFSTKRILTLFKNLRGYTTSFWSDTEKDLRERRSLNIENTFK